MLDRKIIFLGKIGNIAQPVRLSRTVNSTKEDANSREHVLMKLRKVIFYFKTVPLNMEFGHRQYY